MTSDSESDFSSKNRSQQSIVSEAHNVTFTLPPGGTATETPFLTNPESNQSWDNSECMEVEAVDLSIGLRQASDSIYILMDPSSSTGIKNGGNCLCIEWSPVENTLTAPPLTVASIEDQIPEQEVILTTSSRQSAATIGKVGRKRGPPKVKAPKGTKSRRLSNNKPSPNKKTKVDSSEEVFQPQESKARITSNSQDALQIQSSVLPNDEPSSSCQLPDSQFGEGTIFFFTIFLFKLLTVITFCFRTPYVTQLVTGRRVCPER